MPFGQLADYDIECTFESSRQRLQNLMSDCDIPKYLIILTKINFWKSKLKWMNPYWYFRSTSEAYQSMLVNEFLSVEHLKPNLM